ncbi:hypothetical protein V757_12290 [Pelistega indica]|uniref:Uncharacterized protein n=1 Tax=Pelistega indica TaxID=1414851 RepID=V8FS05_9BURK|nr:MULTISPECIES: hypothetical protein [Pelistega]ETD66671.1 hypothetical protein V757_12290 [Pelistega indica]
MSYLLAFAIHTPQPAWVEQDAQFAVEGSVFMAGAIQWLRDNLGFIQHSHEVEALAPTVTDSH